MRPWIPGLALVLAVCLWGPTTLSAAEEVAGGSFWSRIEDLRRKLGPTAPAGPLVLSAAERARLGKAAPKPAPGRVPRIPDPLDTAARDAAMAAARAHIAEGLDAYMHEDPRGFAEMFSLNADADVGILRNAAREDFQLEGDIRVEVHYLGDLTTTGKPALRLRWNRTATDRRTGVPRVESGQSLVLLDPTDSFKVKSWRESAPFGRTDRTAGSQLRMGDPSDRTDQR